MTAFNYGPERRNMFSSFMLRAAQRTSAGCTTMVFLGILLIASPAVAWQASIRAVGILSDYVNRLEERGTPVFISACQVDDHDKAVVLFEMGEVAGRFFLIRDRVEGGFALAGISGGITIMNGAPSITWDGKGPDHLDAFDALVSRLMALPFLLLQVDRLNEIYSTPASSRC